MIGFQGTNQKRTFLGTTHDYHFKENPHTLGTVLTFPSSDSTKTPGDSTYSGLVRRFLNDVPVTMLQHRAFENSLLFALVRNGIVEKEGRESKSSNTCDNGFLPLLRMSSWITNPVSHNIYSATIQE